MAQLQLLLSFFLCLLLMAIGAEQRSLARPLFSSSTLRLGLTHRDFGSLINSSSNRSFSQAMQLALQRSSLRLAHLQHAISLVTTHNKTNYEIPVSTAPGYFLTTVSIGTPPVSFTAIVDTGSDLVWRQCQPCLNCYNQPGTTFDPAKSSTYQKASCSDALCIDLPQTECDSSSACTYTYSYGDRSFTSGDLSYDTLLIPDASGKAQAIANFAFGCGQDNEGGDFAGAGGLIGLGQGPLSLTSQLSIAKFSYCLQTITDPASMHSPLSLGSGATIASYAQSTPIITNAAIRTLYYVHLQGISVGETLLDIPAGTFDIQPDGSGGIVIDSGTTITYLVEPGYAKILEAFRASVKLTLGDGSALGLDLCYKSRGTVPSLTFHFEGADLDLPTDNYFISADGLFCLALGKSSKISILGNIQQQNYQFLYDRGEQKLSFTSAKCDSL